MPKMTENNFNQTNTMGYRINLQRTVDQNNKLAFQQQPRRTSTGDIPITEDKPHIMQPPTINEKVLDSDDAMTSGMMDTYMASEEGYDSGDGSGSTKSFEALLQDSTPLEVDDLVAAVLSSTPAPARNSRTKSKKFNIVEGGEAGRPNNYSVRAGPYGKKEMATIHDEPQFPSDRERPHVKFSGPPSNTPYKKSRSFDNLMLKDEKTRRGRLGSSGDLAALDDDPMPPARSKSFHAQEKPRQDEKPRRVRLGSLGDRAALDYDLSHDFLDVRGDGGSGRLTADKPPAKSMNFHVANSMGFHAKEEPQNLVRGFSTLSNESESVPQHHNVSGKKNLPPSIIAQKSTSFHDDSKRNQHALPPPKRDADPFSNLSNDRQRLDYLVNKLNQAGISHEELTIRSGRSKSSTNSGKSKATSFHSASPVKSIRVSNSATGGQQQNNQKKVDELASRLINLKKMSKSTAKTGNTSALRSQPYRNDRGAQTGSNLATPNGTKVTSTLGTDKADAVPTPRRHHNHENGSSGSGSLPSVPSLPSADSYSKKNSRKPPPPPPRRPHRDVGPPSAKSRPPPPPPSVTVISTNRNNNGEWNASASSTSRLSIDSEVINSIMNDHQCSNNEQEYGSFKNMLQRRSSDGGGFSERLSPRKNYDSGNTSKSPNHKGGSFDHHNGSSIKSSGSNIRKGGSFDHHNGGSSKNKNKSEPALEVLSEYAKMSTEQLAEVEASNFQKLGSQSFPELDPSALYRPIHGDSSDGNERSGSYNNSNSKHNHHASLAGHEFNHSSASFAPRPVRVTQFEDNGKNMDTPSTPKSRPTAVATKTFFNSMRKPDNDGANDSVNNTPMEIPNTYYATPSSASKNKTPSVSSGMTSNSGRTYPSKCTADNLPDNVDKKGRCIRHPRVKIFKKKLMGGYEQVRDMCPKCHEEAPYENLWRGRARVKPMKNSQHSSRGPQSRDQSKERKPMLKGRTSRSRERKCGKLDDTASTHPGVPSLLHGGEAELPMQQEEPMLRTGSGPSMEPNIQNNLIPPTPLMSAPTLTPPPLNQDNIPVPSPRRMDRRPERGRSNLRGRTRSSASSNNGRSTPVPESKKLRARSSSRTPAHEESATVLARDGRTMGNRSASPYSNKKSHKNKFDQKTGRCKIHPSILMARKSKFNKGWDILRECPICDEERKATNPHHRRGGDVDEFDEISKKKMNALLSGSDTTDVDGGECPQHSLDKTPPPSGPMNYSSRTTPRKNSSLHETNQTNKQISTKGSRRSLTPDHLDFMDNANPSNDLEAGYVSRMPYITPWGESGWYTGEINKAGKPHGKGRMRANNGNSIDGKWVNGYSSVFLEKQGRMKSGFGTNMAKWEEKYLADPNGVRRSRSGSRGRSPSRQSHAQSTHSMAPVRRSRSRSRGQSPSEQPHAQSSHSVAQSSHSMAQYQGHYLAPQIASPYEYPVPPSPQATYHPSLYGMAPAHSQPMEIWDHPPGGYQSYQSQFYSGGHDNRPSPPAYHPGYH